MSFQLTQRVIKLLCGRFAYEDGEAYYLDHKVKLTDYDPEEHIYEAQVQGTRLYQVRAQIDRQGDIHADCTCSLYSQHHYCKHIAALLLHIHDIQHTGRSLIRARSSSLLHRDGVIDGEESRGARSGASTFRASGVSAGDLRLMDEMLGLFSDKPLRSDSSRVLTNTRMKLDIEIICRPFPYSYRKHMFGIELKIGSKRLYIVQKIREFLDRLDKQEAYVFSKHFIYDPLLHSFQKEHAAILQQLIQICHNENMYRESLNGYSKQTSGSSGDRMLLIPPLSWETLYPLLAAAPAVQLHQGNRVYEGIQLSDERIPLQFEFDQSQVEGYQLDIQGMENLTVMDAYGIVLSEGKLLKLQNDAIKRLSELKHILADSRKDHIQIPQEHMESFMEKVIPSLMKLGSVSIAHAISERIVHLSLKAKLYLDRIKSRLLAGLEFQYGDIVINPLEAHGPVRGSDWILMRDGEQERRILELMEQSPFAKTEAGYFLDDEDSEYEFLYHTLPELEKLLEVYATSAVKARLHSGPAAPKVTVEVNERTDWLEFRFEMDGIPEADIRNLLKSLEEKHKFYRLPNGAMLPLESAEFQEIIRFMNEFGIQNADLSGANIQLPLLRGMHLLDSPRQGNAIKLGKSFRRLLDNMRNPDHLDFPVPESLTPVLRNYQQYGYQWLRTLAHYHFGGILADDMGLGKTLQSIAFILSMLPEIRTRQQPAIIVSPASLIYNWQNELKKFAPELRTVIVDGSKEERCHILKGAPEYQADVLITSYPLLRRDIELYAKLSFHTLILDEAQVFKNHATQTARAVKEIQALYRFALTGTPVENRLEELWSIFDAVFPELFPSRKAFNELPREVVAKRVRPFLLRRLKSDVLKELPDKIESLQASELLPEQKKLYVAYLAKLQQETVKHLNEKGFQKNRIKILAGLTRLRQLCCHPALFVEGYAGSSAKFEQLMEIIEECRSAGKRMLVFSQFTEMLGLIRRELGYLGLPHFYLDGSTPVPERVELCNRFNEGEHDLFLISLKAGGTGLNLTGADTVILYDLWWNPAVEQQAADRAHRIGQKNVVQVIRLVTQGTVEDKMYELQQKKKNLIDEVIQPGQEALSTLTEQELREILMIP
ncbi:Superfamily II DNA or RNA helicase, SNF2 family [Paenibacillus sp. 1_12]|uniref:DEAD/DEAH box helicase n=1 Tax=Paenibacillus sp. 1_12 TaxID=1566278 RepID=UPI0008EFB24A|nr:DEAD/DEAH box helicase [Paenibacillus sp. 1_12]SFL97602.1 Superfamily II DNA or RNA helicase, SNF2 family [Paenibacillus sp. 1_12]